MACGRCASQANVENEVENHLAVCSYEMLEVKALALPNLSAPTEKSRPTTRDLIRAGARTGATMGAQRSPHYAVAGGALGVALGALAGHVLGRPEVQPVIDLIQGLREPVEDVLTIARGKK